jgi:glucose-1-phosphatase
VRSEKQRSVPHIKAVLFDLGGVLVALRGEEHVRSLLGANLSRERFWQLWAHSPAVRAHETGKISADQFAQEIVAELGIDVAPAIFLRDFRDWIVGPFPETPALIRDAALRFTTALLTNTSALHWPTIESLDILPHMHHVHASFQVGLIKPDRNYFDTALEKVGCAADEALFFDDSAVNIVAATALGIHAHRVDSAAEAHVILNRY